MSSPARRSSGPIRRQARDEKRPTWLMPLWRLTPILRSNVSETENEICMTDELPGAEQKARASSHRAFGRFLPKNDDFAVQGRRRHPQGRFSEWCADGRDPETGGRGGADKKHRSQISRLWRSDADAQAYTRTSMSNDVPGPSRRPSPRDSRRWQRSCEAWDSPPPGSAAKSAFPEP